MKRTLDKSALQKMASIYGFRAMRVEKAVQEQRGVVAGVRAEVVERTEKVDGLTRSIERNDEYMQDPAVSSDAQAMQQALRHRHWLDYDRQRATFYLELTEQELVDANDELKQRVDSLAKLDAKRTNVGRLARQSAAQAEKAEELAAEEETEGRTRKIGVLDVQE